MKTFIIFTLVFVFIYLSGFIKAKKDEIQWLDRKYTNVLKGLSILTVMWAHGGAKVDIGGIQFVAGIGVAIFLIISGYGLESSYRKNGLKLFWLKRVGRIIIPMILAEIFYGIIVNHFSWENVWNRVVNIPSFDWFIAYILLCYVIYYFAKIIFVKIFKLNDKAEVIALIIVFSMIFIFESVHPLYSENSFVRTRQMYSFITGVIFAKYKNIIIAKIKDRETIKIAVFLSCIGCICMIISQLPYIKNDNILLLNFFSLPTVYCFAIALLIIVEQARVIINNNNLYLIGIISYELYLSHSYALHHTNSNVKSILIFIINAFILSILVHFSTKIIYSIPSLLRKKKLTQ